MTDTNPTLSKGLSRRHFLAGSAGAAAAALLAACGGSEIATTVATVVPTTVTGAATQAAPTVAAAVATVSSAATSAAPSVNAAVTTVSGAATTAAPTVAAAATTLTGAATVAAPTVNAAASTVSSAATRVGGATIELSFFYPTAASGPIVPIINGYVDDFNKKNTGIKVTPTYAGGYTDVYTKVQTTIDGGGTPPDTAVLLSTDLYALKDADYIVPFDEYLKDPAFIGDFYDAFMLNSKDSGKVYGIPFQRSTPVLYYNKDMFKEAGLNPDQPPKTWAEMVDMSKKLTKPDGSRWGVEIPSDGFPYWVFQGMAIGNGKNYVDDTGTKLFLNDPAVVQALQSWVDIGQKDKVGPNSIVIWATTPPDFTGGKTAMAWHTTGSLSNILQTAKFNVGVGFLPGLKQNGAPTGGGNFYLFKKTPKEKQAAAFEFIKYMSSPETQARWTVDSGYVAARKSAWDQTALKDYTAKNPQALVARDQLQFAQREFSTHSGPQVQKVFGDELQAALTLKKTPQQAMDDAQKNADNILKQFR